MKKFIGRFIFDLMVRTVHYLDDDTYDKFMARVYRPQWTRRLPLPKSDDRTIRMFHYTESGKRP